MKLVINAIHITIYLRHFLIAHFNDQIVKCIVVEKVVERIDYVSKWTAKSNKKIYEKLLGYNGKWK
jgi:uncharacterized protein YqhQ